MGQGALIWFVVTVLPGGAFEAKAYHMERSCRTVAEAYQRIHEQTSNGRQSFCAQATPAELAEHGARISALH